MKVRTNERMERDIWAAHGMESQNDIVQNEDGERATDKGWWQFGGEKETKERWPFKLS